MSNSNAYSTDTKLPFPRLSAVLSVWEPDDSKHGGKLYLRHPIGGAPHYEDFTQTAGAWRAKLHEVKAGLEDQFRSSHIFTDHRIDDWQRFWGAYPWDGLGDLAAEDAPSFYVPAFPDAPTFVGDEEVEDLMRVAGEDKEGRPRLYFDKGMDMLTYPRGRSKTTYSGFHLDGTAHQKKRPAPGIVEVVVEKKGADWIIGCVMGGLVAECKFKFSVLLSIVPSPLLSSPRSVNWPICPGLSRRPP